MLYDIKNLAKKSRIDQSRFHYNHLIAFSSIYIFHFKLHHVNEPTQLVSHNNTI